MRSKVALFSACSLFILLAVLFWGNPVSPRGSAVYAYPPPPTPMSIQGQGLARKLSLPLITNNYKSPPNPTTSVYVEYNDTTKMYNLGYTNGRNAKSGVLILDFGNPRMFNGTPGTSLALTQTTVTISNITSLTENFIVGYWNGYNYGGGSGIDPNAFLTVAVGLNNCGYTSSYTSTDPHNPCVPFGSNMPASHGYAWAQMVNTIGNWLVSLGYRSRVGIASALDAEEGWNDYPSIQAWLDSGYNAYFCVGIGCPTDINLYDFGTCDGCMNYPSWTSYSYSVTTTAGTKTWSWSLDNIRNVSYSGHSSRAMPEIYYDGSNGYPNNPLQWYYVSRFSYDKYAVPLTFSGVTTQTSGYTPSQGWLALWAKLWSDPVTQVNDIPYLTQINWQAYLQ